MDFPTVIPFAAELGFELLSFGGGEAQISVQLRPALCNHWQVAHGGLTMTLLDVVMAHAARAAPHADSPGELGVVTVEMKTSFLLPGMGRLVGQGKVLHRSRSLAFCEGYVVHSNGERIAHATGTFKFVRERHAPAASTE